MLDASFSILDLASRIEHPDTSLKHP
jgi:hypothetical protein